MTKYFIYTIGFAFYCNKLLACPMCAGGKPTGVTDFSTIIALAVFIALTYIPFFLFYKLSLARKKIEKNHNV